MPSSVLHEVAAAAGVAALFGGHGGVVVELGEQPPAAASEGAGVLVAGGGEQDRLGVGGVGVVEPAQGVAQQLRVAGWELTGIEGAAALGAVGEPGAELLGAFGLGGGPAQLVLQLVAGAPFGLACGVGLARVGLERAAALPVGQRGGEPAGARVEAPSGVLDRGELGPDGLVVELDGRDRRQRGDRRAERVPARDGVVGQRVAARPVGPFVPLRALVAGAGLTREPVPVPRLAGAAGSARLRSRDTPSWERAFECNDASDSTRGPA
jgi:hypothetical protein